MDIILIRGGDKHAAAIAAASGMKYGIRHDYIPYGNVFMLDIHWVKYDWRDYLRKVDQYKPIAAMAPDYEYHWQYTNLRRQIDDLWAHGVNRVLVCPKFDNAINHIPRECIVALSIPAPTYAGYIPPDLDALSGRSIHLLGGSPEKQAQWIMRLNAIGATVISTDGNYHVRKAAHGQWFDGGKWVQLRGKKVNSIDLAIASGRAIVDYLNDANTRAQLSLT